MSSRTLSAAKLWLVPWHPFLLAAFPTLHVYATNAAELLPAQTVRPLIVSIGVAALTMLILWLACRNVWRAALGASIFVWLLLNYRFLALAVHLVLPAGTIFIWTALVAVGLWLAMRASYDEQGATRIVNAAAFTLIALSCITLASAARATRTGRVDLGPRLPEPPRAVKRPNIYCVLVDSLARPDVLKRLYGLDISDFVDFLRARGFCVPPRSRANYAQTMLVLASMFNMNYLDKLIARLPRDMFHRGPVVEQIRRNAVCDYLHKLGYTTVVFPSFSVGFDILAWDAVDTGAGVALNRLEALLLQRTPLGCLHPRRLSVLARKILGAKLISRLSALCADPIAIHRRLTLHALRHLGVPPGVKEPCLCFAHVLCPHPPFAFDRHGNPVPAPWDQHDGTECYLTGEDYIRAYREQAIFVTSELRKLADRLIREDPDAVIVIFSDHGPGLRLDFEHPDKTDMSERMSNFIALRVPGLDCRRVPPTLSPVNVFRIIFNTCFGTTLPLLPDRSFFSRWSRPYDLIEYHWPDQACGAGRQPSAPAAEAGAASPGCCRGGQPTG